MTNFKLAVLFASACLLPGVAPAMAASARTAAFVINARPNVNFLDRSSRLALEKAGNQRIRTFAHEEAEEQTIAANAFVAWAETNTPRGEVMALGGGGVAVVTTPVGGVLSGAGEGANQALSPLGPVGTIAAAPLTVAGGVTNGVGAVVDGAAGGVLPGTQTTPQGPLIGAGLLPADRENMDHLATLEGRQFDVLYRSTQQDSLRQLAILYRDYVTNGDDPALQALAASELPKVNHRLSELGLL